MDKVMARIFLTVGCGNPDFCATELTENCMCQYYTNRMYGIGYCELFDQRTRNTHMDNSGFPVRIEKCISAETKS